MSLKHNLSKIFKGRRRDMLMVESMEDLDERVSSNESILENAVDNDTIYDDTDLWTVTGVSKDTDLTDNFTDLATRIDGKADSSALNTKANANHSHTLSSVTDLETVEVVVTYTDSTTETLYLVKQVQSQPQT